MSYPSPMTLKVDFDRQEDGRWIAVVESIPGCHVDGKTRQEALRKVEALALHAVAEKSSSDSRLAGHVGVSALKLRF